MANCSGCPYRWHDSDCEYCSMKNDEVIDLKNYSKETCPYYKEYMKSKGVQTSTSSSSSSGSGSGCAGCFGFLCILPIVTVILSVVLSIILSIFDIDFSLAGWILEKISELLMSLKPN